MKARTADSCGEAASAPRHSPRGPALRPTRRERILLAMACTAAVEGYAETTIAKVIAHAEISRPAFYEHFDSKGACFSAVERRIAADLLERVQVAVGQGAPAGAAESAVRCVADFATRAPERARLLLCESLAADPAALDERDRVVDAIAGAIERRQARCPPQAAVADLPSWTLVGAVFWLIDQRLRRGSGDLRDLADEIVDWVRRYERPLDEHRWRASVPGTPPPPSHVVSELPSEPPSAPSLRRRGACRQQALRNQRERILHASAVVASRTGYNATSVTEILAEADVDKRAFYSIFANKQAAFLAAYELGVQHAGAVVARAFFSACTWPERVWESVLAGTQFHATHPMLSHVLYVQSHAIDDRGVAPIDRTQAAFTIFHHEGNRLAAEPLGEATMQAAAAAAFEIAFLCSREGRDEQISLMAPLIAYLCLAPYIGPRSAEELIDEKMAASTAQQVASR
jgi:AcrR family transcriptional regulator